VRPTPAPTVRPTPAPTVRPTPAPTPSPSVAKKPLEITPPVVGPQQSNTEVTVNNIIPGQKLRVTVVEGNSATPSKVIPKPKPASTPRPLPAENSFKVTTKNPVKVEPKPSGSSAAIGITNLKPDQKIKVTVKTGGTTR
jgi:hypothetical protein